MWGAIIGDLAGSIYEYDQTKKISLLEPKDLILEESFFSDDTILTIAVLDAILNDKNYEYFLRLYANKFMDYKPNVKSYFEYPFSPGFINWVNKNNIGNSVGNGAMMRISPVGYLFNSEEEIKKEVIKATIPSHNSKEAIDAATLIALIIYYGRKGYNKEDIIKKLKLNFEYIDFKHFNMTCSETINNCLYALFTSNSFEESLLKVISYGGDTDTNACIVGSMAEALYGIDEDLINKAILKIPQAFVKKLEKGYKKIRD